MKEPKSLDAETDHNHALPGIAPPSYDEMTTEPTKNNKIHAKTGVEYPEAGFQNDSLSSAYDWLIFNAHKFDWLTI